MSKNIDSEDNIVMACIFAVSVFGLVSNGLSLYMLRTRSYFRNAFGILCSSFLVCNLQSISVLFMWCTIVLTVSSFSLSDMHNRLWAETRCAASYPNHAVFNKTPMNRTKKVVGSDTPKIF